MRQISRLGGLPAMIKGSPPVRVPGNLKSPHVAVHHVRNVVPHAAAKPHVLRQPHVHAVKPVKVKKARKGRKQKIGIPEPFING